MFNFRSLELVHWDFWQRFSLPLDTQIITIVGPNGSGKTTLLDALRTLLGLDCSGKRDYKRYVRRSNESFAWLRAVVDNRRIANQRHPFFPIMEDEVTLACRIRKQGGDWQRQYLIVPGNIAIEDLEKNAEWLGVKDYKRRLGLSAAIAEVLALEQGDTDKLCEYSPKALLDLVFQVFGDKQILEAYTEAKTQQRETERELQAMDVQLTALDNQVEKYTSRVNRYREWENLQREQRALETETLPRLRLIELRDSISGAQNQLRGQRRQLRDRVQDAEQTRQLHSAQEAALTAAEQQENRANAEYKAASERFAQLREQQIKTQAVLDEREKLRRLCQSEASQDTAKLAEELGQARQQLATLEAEMRNLRERRAECTSLIAALRSGKAPSPGFVNQVRAALDEANIAHRLLPDIIEIADTGWQSALEAVLAPYRHLILLRREADKIAAWQIGERLNYRHFISSDQAEVPTALAGSLLEVVSFSSLPPAWLANLLNRIQRVAHIAQGRDLPAAQDWITRDGYQRERRGGRHIGIAKQDYQFGESAKSARLEAAANEESVLNQQLNRLEQQSLTLRQKVQHNDGLLKGINAAQMLEIRADEFSYAEQKLATLHSEVQTAGQQLASADSAKTSTNEARHAADKQLGKTLQQLTDLNKKITDLQENLRNPREEQIKRIQLFRQDRAKRPQHWFNKIEQETLKQRYGDATHVRFRINELVNRFNSEQWETDDAVILLLAKFQNEFTTMQKENDQRRADNQRAQSLTDGARGEYINVLRATVRQYLKNIRHLGELAGIVVHGELPPLENDDLALAQAGLEVNFNFDSKGMMGMNDGEASGGQQVMKSLILLIGLMMDEDQSSGFVFIDEPFAHLDIFNIDRVSAFLKATRAQYLITSPITHNVNVYDPSQLTLVTHKKRPGDAWAPPVAVITRQM